MCVCTWKPWCAIFIVKHEIYTSKPLCSLPWADYNARVTVKPLLGALLRKPGPVGVDKAFPRLSLVWVLCCPGTAWGQSLLMTSLAPKSNLSLSGCTQQSNLGKTRLTEECVCVCTQGEFQSSGNAPPELQNLVPHFSAKPEVT